MPPSDRHTIAARIVIGCVSALFILTAVTTFYQFGRSPTDENIFADPPSRLYVRSEIVTKASAVLITAGELLCEVNGRKILTPEDLPAILRSIAPDSLVNVTVFRPIDKAYATIGIPRIRLDDSAFTWIKSGVYVVSVEDGGASDRAGMKVGDLIVRINEQEFTSAVEADRILRRGQSGRTILYDVLRGRERHGLQVTLARFGFPLSALILSLTGFVYLAVGSFIALKKPNLKPARLLGLGFLLLGFFLAIVAVRRDPDVTLGVMIRSLIMIPSLFFGIALVWHSELYFPRELPALVAKRWIRYVGYGIALLFTVFTILAGPLSLVRGNFEVPVAIAAVIVMSMYALVVRFASRKYRTKEYNRQRRAITVAGLSVAALSAVAILLVAFRKSQELLGLWSVILVLFPLAYLYTIGRYQLLDMNLRVRRNIQYTLASIIWGGIVGVVFIAIVVALLSVNLNLPGVVLRGASVELTDIPKVPGESNPLERLVVVLAAAGTWFVLWKVRRWGQGKIDAKYYRTQYDYRLAAKELAEMLATKLSMVDLGIGLVEKIVGLMKLKRAAVFFFKDEAICCCREAHGIDPKIWSSFCVKDELSLAQAAANFKAGFSVDLLPPGLKEQFRQQDFKHLVPIRSKEHLIGLLVLGEKLSESPFTSDDIEFLTAASSQASVSIENAFLYEELAEKERMKHELEIARQIQLASLPQQTPEVPGLEIAGRSIPALEVGGDFFDYLNGQQGHLTVVVGDVSGKGTSAALYMSKVQGIIRSLHGLAPSLTDLFTRANRLLCNDMEKKSFITAVGATFDTGRKSLVLARAGHLPLYRFSARSTGVEAVTPRGLGLGLENAGLFSSELEETSFRYDRGDVLLFVTDGITEARDARNEEFGEERLLRILKEHSSSSATQMRDLILDEVRSYAGELPPHDDQTVVVVKAV